MDIYNYFSAKLNCYESDLRTNPELRWIPAMILSVPEEAFSLESWDAFLSYVFSTPLHFSSVDAAKAYLIEKKADC